MDLLDQGDHCLLAMTDVSKTGMIAPGSGLLVGLQQRFSGRLTVLVDACQMRLSPPTLRGYLEKGFWVVITGSKFLSGPTFAGDLLLPSGTSRDHPELSKHTVHPGLVLRWEAALEELRAFSRVPPSQVHEILKTIADRINQYLYTSENLLPLAVPAISRSVGYDYSWDRLQTIFPFVPTTGKDPAGRIQPLSREQAFRVYQCLQQVYPQVLHPAGDLRCQLGQPVHCSQLEGSPPSALRLCASSRLVVEASRGNLERIIESAQAALDKAAWLATEMTRS